MLMMMQMMEMQMEMQMELRIIWLMQMILQRGSTISQHLYQSNQAPTMHWLCNLH